MKSAANTPPFDGSSRSGDVDRDIVHEHGGSHGTPAPDEHVTSTPPLSRRGFVKVVSVAGAGLTLGISLEGCGGTSAPPAPGAAFAPNAWLRIAPDGAITMLIDKSEMGQGVTTALPQLVAEELDVPVARIGIEFAPAHEAYRNPAFNMQLTGGSTSVSSSFTPLREAGATARWLLREAAARRWGTPASDLTTSDGFAVHPDGRTLAYGELAAEAATLEVPESVALKSTSEFSVIGTSPPRLDVPPKVRGEAVFGIDAGPDAAQVAVVARCPVFGGSVRSFDPSKALAVSGVSDVVQIGTGIAVVADGYWNAARGRQALEIEWDEGPAAALDDASIRSTLEAGVRQEGKQANGRGDVAQALADADHVVRAQYGLPYLAHATMEPMNCTALVENGRCTVWAPTQWQEAPGYMGGGAKGAAAEAAGISFDDVDVRTTYLGGGFGRRGQLDYVAEAAELASRVEGPVKVVWSREDDMQHDFYRPTSYHELEASLGGESGRPTGWRHHMALQSIMDTMIPGWMPEFLASWMGILPGGIDPTSVEGAQNLPYAIPNLDVRLSTVELPVPVGFWRSVGSSHNAFVVESFIDELAHAAGRDPFEYRRSLLESHPRHRAVLEAAAEAASWGSTPPEGRARGIAVAESFGSFVAEVAEVSVTDRGEVRVHKVWCAVDCGIVVNPAIVRDQMVLAPSGDAPGGVGEPGTPPIAAAVTNALFALTGQRVRELPIRLD
jgi:isoquinoline 1-oxidoreductase beta subunit